MKQIVLVLISVFIFSCQKEEKTLDVINKHNNERVLADLIVTTPTVLTTSATYGTIEIKNGGNLTINPGVVINCTEFKSTVNHIYSTFLDVKQNGEFNITGSVSTNINPLTTIHVRGVFRHAWWLDLFGYITVYPTGTYYSVADIMIHQGQFTINGGTVYNQRIGVQSQMWMVGSGILKFEQCGALITDRMVVDAIASNKVLGTGRIKAFQSILRGSLTSSNKIIYCAQEYYYPEPTGTTGAANVNCLKLCFEL